MTDDDETPSKNVEPPPTLEPPPSEPPPADWDLLDDGFAEEKPPEFR